MEATWQLYAAIALGLVALAIIALFIYLLLNPAKNSFDKGSREAKATKKREQMRKKGKK